jgi:LmbE family N-acetylglucosaminyl deacetylase
MSDALTLASSDRLLILAPHPDDESIATGALIQVARSVGAAVRVVVLTDGDNNPWPQRWIEKRWRIDAAARQRWGARRREEARAAVRVLGLTAEDAVFLGFPDLGLTDLLMRDDQQIIRALRTQLDEVNPTMLIMPALSDRHPDHSAVHILARAALAQLPIPRLYTFAVHGRGDAAASASIALTPQQRDIKQAAILAHQTQMQLSRSRFLRYADSAELYQSEAAQPDELGAHPLRARFRDHGLLQVSVDLTRWNRPRRGHALFVALDSGERILQPLAHSAKRSGDGLHIEIRCPRNSAGYVKLALPEPGWRVFDRHGWQRFEST